LGLGLRVRVRVGLGLRVRVRVRARVRVTAVEQRDAALHAARLGGDLPPYGPDRALGVGRRRRHRLLRFG